MSTIIAIDPGTVRSGWMTFDQNLDPWQWGWWKNEDIIDKLLTGFEELVIEDMAHFGPNIRVGRDVFETCKWMGRFHQQAGDATYLPRTAIKTHITGMSSSKDKDVRVALIDRYGGESEAIGGKKCLTCKGKGWNGTGRPMCTDCHCIGESDTGCGYQTHPGKLHGIKAHEWSALAIGLTYIDSKTSEVPL
tara:strand:- start:161 stop:733 length:573 start_codon:yes stop_codon:yes gene_type:complete